MALESNALTTVGRVQLHLGISGEVPLLSWLINTASQKIESDCNRAFGQTLHTAEEYEGTSSEYLPLEQWPITDVDSISIDGVAVTDYSIKGAFLYRESGWLGDVVVTYTAGYVLPKDVVAYSAGPPEVKAVDRTLPFDIESACVLLVSAAYNSRGSEHLSSEAVGPLRSDYYAEIPAVKSTIDKYRRVAV